MSTQNNKEQTKEKPRGSNRAQTKLEIFNSESFRKKAKRGIEQLKVYKSQLKLDPQLKRSIKSLSMPLDPNNKK